jgi:O-antigen/teichoic acid export membrane protein
MIQLSSARGIQGLPGVRRAAALPWHLVRRASRRIGWGIADQGMSSITNFAVNIYIARTLGAEQYGAFSLAYVTYSFILNGSRGLSTDPLLVRFSGADVPAWRRAVSGAAGTAAVVGLVSGLAIVAIALFMHGPTRLAFLALGLTLPGLMLQDSWRFAFFALGRGWHSFINDAIWAVVLIPTLIMLNHAGHPSVLWYLLAWGGAAAVGAVAGALQARVLPNPRQAVLWVSRHRDLGPRYLLEGTANAAATQLRNYGVALILGLAALGYVQAASTLMGPFMVVFLGMGLVILPEAARVLRRSARHLPAFCLVVSGGLTVLGIAWGVVLLVALPNGLGHFMLGNIWRPTYPLVIPSVLSILGGCISTGAGAGLHALGAARRSLRAMIISGALYVIGSVAGAFIGGAPGALYGTAIMAWIGALIFWLELFGGIHESDATRRGRHRKDQLGCAMKDPAAAVSNRERPRSRGHEGHQQQPVSHRASSPGRGFAPSGGDDTPS